MSPNFEPGEYVVLETLDVARAAAAQFIAAAFSQHGFEIAEKYLEDRLVAAEREQPFMPDRRILRYLIGICASAQGNFLKAKRSFESMFNGACPNRGSHLEEGDIAAARWLGDVCLQLREHHNAALAWGIAFEGYLGRYGFASNRTGAVFGEQRLLDT